MIPAIAVFGTLSSGTYLDSGALGPYLWTLLVAVPCAAILMTGPPCLYRGPVRWTSPLIYALVFVANFAIGGVSGMPLALPPLGAQMRDTSFETSHFHYFLAGGTITVFLAGLHFWWPTLTGRHYPEAL